MLRPSFETADEYLAAQPESARAVLNAVRRTVHAAIPGAEEGIGYGVLAFRAHGTYAVYLAGFARHYSIYPATEHLRRELGDAVAPYLAGKGTLRFSLNEPIPTALIARVAATLADEARQRAEERGKRRASRAADRGRASR